MKKIFYLLIVMMFFYSVSVNAADCEYLTYVTTQDTVARAGTMTATPKNIQLKKGTEFKMCYIAGGDNSIVLSDDRRADIVEKGTYKLKESFDIEKAHTIDKTGVLYKDVDVYSDPSALTIVGTAPKDLEINVIYYYGPYYYFEDSSISGWVYLESIHFNDTDTVDQDNDMVDGTDTIDQNNKVEDNNSYNTYIVIFSVVIALILVVSIIVTIIRKKRYKNDLES